MQLNLMTSSNLTYGNNGLETPWICADLIEPVIFTTTTSNKSLHDISNEQYPLGITYYRHHQQPNINWRFGRSVGGGQRWSVKTKTDFKGSVRCVDVKFLIRPNASISHLGERRLVAGREIFVGKKIF